MPIKLNGSSSGYTQIEAAATAGDNTLTLPTTSGTLMTTGGTNTFTANQVIEVNDNSNAALRITQLGTGNALVVEDSTNPDSTPFVVDASGNVGIGTSSPSARFDVRGGDGTGGISGPTSGTWAAKIVMNQDNDGYSGLSVQNRWANDTTPILEVASGWNGSAAGYYPVYTVNGTGVAIWKSSTGTERMRIDSSGNIGIGTGSPSNFGGTNLQVQNSNIGSILWSNGTITGQLLASASAEVTVGSRSNHPLRFSTNDTERMRIGTDGRVGIGVASDTSNTLKISTKGLRGLMIEGSGTPADYMLIANTQASNFTSILFVVNGVQVGNIAHNTTATSYNTSSDYRLKENIAPIADASSRVMQLKPCRFNFKIDPDNPVDGFIAHEAAEVVPEAVTGAKDDVRIEDELDEHGAKIGTKEVPVYQGIDQSKLVPLLTAALQEALTKIDALEARLAALENA